VSEFRLGEYLNRVGHTGGAVQTNVETLKSLHRAHLDAIPFENLDIQMGGSVALDAEALQAKLVRRRRGGYCFEHNTLLSMALRSIGFVLETCEARVRQNAAGAVRPRTHMVLRVRVDGNDWLADVGFGGDGLLEPIALDGGTTVQGGVPYRVSPEQSLRVLQRFIAGGWEDLYAVLPDPVYPIDLEAGNWFTSTHPHSPFVLNLTAQRMSGGTRHILRNLTYSTARGTEVHTRQIERSELIPLLRGIFGIDVEDDARFRAVDGQEPAVR
jgi:N-hydroxyarylamine O-acetyltransferase